MILPCIAFLSLAGTDELLRRIADAQENAIAARRSIVYRQEVKAKLIRGNGVLAREERYVYDVMPTDVGVSKTLVEFEGWYADKGRRVPYDEPGFERKEMDIDADLIADIVKDLVNDPGSRDGLDRNLFPLTRDEQAKYDFRLEGNRLKFEPRRRESAWRGEMSLGEDGHPVSVTTSLARKVPMWVRVTLGTNFHQVGFAASYRKVGEGLWFPVSFGTEFRMRVLFGYARTLTLSVVNSDFRRATADSSIQFER